MPRLEVNRLKQKAVLWAYASVNDYGEPIVSAAVEIPVRWENVQQEYTNPQGNTVGIEAIVTVNRVITVDSILWLGNLADLPGTPTNLKKVVRIVDIPNIKGRNTMREVWCMRYGDSLPTLES